MKILITGGAGFIGSAVSRYAIENLKHEIVILDKLTYAGNLNSLLPIKDSQRFSFIQADICDHNQLNNIFRDVMPESVMHLAAESHVDRSINAPNDFIQTNIIGTYNLLEISRSYFSELDDKKKKNFRFHHISTDEVFGDLHDTGDLFTEESSYMPSSPYSASKASSDHLVRAWQRTFNLPTLVTNCSNNYGPYQFPEKLIPLTILNALSGKDITVYGDGSQIRDWLYVEDHAIALLEVIANGEIGETYNIGGDSEKRNIDVVFQICNILDKLVTPKDKNFKSFSDLIKFVPDRPGHDFRYAIDSSKLKKELSWNASESFDSGILKTVQWYLDNKNWWLGILDGSYKEVSL